MDPSTAAGYIGIGVAGLLFLFPLGLAAFAFRQRLLQAATASKASVQHLSASLSSWSSSSRYSQLAISYLDLVSASKPLLVGTVAGQPSTTLLLGKRKPSCLGFSTSLLGLGGLAIIAAVLGVKRQNSNTLTQHSLVVLQSSLLANSAAWPWAQAPVPGLPAQVSGVLLRVTASGGVPGECNAPVAGTLTSSGLTSGAWVQLPSAASPTSVSYPASQLTFSCPTCIFSGLSILSFRLPFACQSLFFEAAAVGADGAYNSLHVPAELTAAQPGKLLAGVLWELTPLLDLRNDTITPANNAKGWQLIAKDWSSTFSVPAAQAGGCLLYSPSLPPLQSP